MSIEIQPKFITINKKGGDFVVINTTSIASIEQNQNEVSFTMKETKEGENISYVGHYDLPTILSMLTN